MKQTQEAVVTKKRGRPRNAFFCVCGAAFSSDLKLNGHIAGDPSHRAASVPKLDAVPVRAGVPEGVVGSLRRHSQVLTTAIERIDSDLQGLLKLQDQRRECCRQKAVVERAIAEIESGTVIPVASQEDFSSVHYMDDPQ